MHSKVSIIIPLYNSEKTIKPAIDSCLNQTYENVEIIVIDDGSTDNSKQEIQKYIENIKIKYYYQSNKERSAARNYGLDVATGDYINFLDSDDLLHINKIEKQVRFLDENHDYFAVYSAVKYFEDKTGRCISISGNEYKGQAVIDNLVLRNFVPIQSVLFRKNSVRFDENLSASEDWDFFLNIFFGKNVHYINEVLSSVRWIDRHYSRNYIKEIRSGQIVFLNRLMKDARFRSRRLSILMVLAELHIKNYALILKSITG